MDARIDYDDAGPFGPGSIAGFAARFPPGTRFIVAFSGGPDSLALLHAFAQARRHDHALRLCAVHVDHHIHADSTRWARQCQEICRQLSVELTVLDIDMQADGAVRDDEGAVRAARYEAFERFISPRDVLCTAHSEDDHVETVLLHLLRGAGPRGLAGIPRARRLGEGLVARPVRGVSRAALCAYAQQTGLALVHDPANKELRFARVTLRERIMPVLETKWPGTRKTLARAAALARESAGLLDALAAIDLKSSGGIGAATLDTAAVAALGPARRRNAVAGWLRARGIESPGARRLDQIAREVIEAKPDAAPCVRLGSVEVRRFQGRLWLAPRDCPAAVQAARQWPISDILMLDHGSLAWAPCRDGGLDNAIRDAEIMVRFRGENASWMRPLHVRGHSLRKRFQQLGVPPWERGRIPLVYADDMLAAVGSQWLNPKLAAAPGKPGWRVVWTPRSTPAAR